MAQQLVQESDERHNRCKATLSFRKEIKIYENYEQEQKMHI